MVAGIQPALVIGTNSLFFDGAENIDNAELSCVKGKQCG